ncbi:MAG: hypothetical protein HC835_14280 [Oscillatoriales cyanobacterium RM2_1_1]|nr:hypothetical protein [Oscillatoriales cyanobacterium SM2_3_0]NJO46689.1 hypothetical protein [Oscillatoriales cyanobacterium RM2_1_1]
MTTVYSTAPDLSPEDYVVVGLATCFIKQEGEVHPVKIVEPIPSAALAALLKGVPTSYELAWATTLGELLTDTGIQIPPHFPPEAQLSDEFSERTFAAARTYQRDRPAQSHIAPGITYREFNYSTERKRILNSDHIVRTEDNVKQHAYTHEVL